MAGTTQRRSWGGHDDERGKRILQRIQELELTRPALSELTGAHYNTVTRWTTGHPFQNERTARALAKALQWNLSDLMGETWSEAAGEEPAPAATADHRLRRVEDKLAAVHADVKGQREDLGALKALLDELLDEVRELRRSDSDEPFGEDTATQSRTPGEQPNQ